MKKFLSIFILSLASAYVSAYERNHEHCIYADQMRACFDEPREKIKLFCIENTFKPSNKLLILTEDEAIKLKNIRSSFNECLDVALASDASDKDQKDQIDQCGKNFYEAMRSVYGCSSNDVFVKKGL